MLSGDLSEIVCGRCTYYKPTKSEALACGAYLLLDQLTRSRGLPPHRGFRIVPPGLALPLSLILCPACGYFREDCDYAAQVEGAPPCGGFITVASLLAQGDLLIDDLCNLL